MISISAGEILVGEFIAVVTIALVPEVGPFLNGHSGRFHNGRFKNQFLS